jgi:tetratricopeptide (TPR) repeat protein
MRRRAIVALLVVLAATLLGLASCGKPAGTASRAPMSDSLRAQALIDSGNSALREGAFAEAAKRYASAAVVRPNDPAAFYGLGMALSRLGRDDEARVAYAKARELSRGDVSADDVPHEIRYRRTTHP